MFSLTFPKLYQNCAIFPIARDRGPAPFPTDWKKTLLNEVLLASDMLYNITFNNIVHFVVIQVLQVSTPFLSLYITYRTFSKQSRPL